MSTNLGSEVDKGCLAMHSAETPVELAESLERLACELLESERATVFRLEDSQRLVPMRKRDDVPASVRLSQGIAGTVARAQRDYACNTPSEDPHFLEAVDGLTGKQIRNLVSAPIVTDEELLGVVQVVNRSRPYQLEDVKSLHSLADHAALALSRLRAAGEGWELLMGLARTVGSMVDERYATVGHVDRVRRMALALGRDMNLSEKELRELDLAAALHDIGRLGVSPESLRRLKKDATSTGQQLEHALNRTLVQRLHFPDHLARLAQIALAPHRIGPKAERQDKPSPIAARILAAADAFDLLSIGEHVEQQGNHLSYSETVEEVRERAGRDLDQSVVDALIEKESFRMERRAHPRFQSKAPMHLNILAPEVDAKEETAEIRSLDMSQGGAQFWCDRELPTNALLELRIVLPTGAVAAFARIARQFPDAEGHGHHVGVYFLGYREEK